MYRALLEVTLLIDGDLYHLRKGELYDWAAQVGKQIVAAGYAEKAAGETAQAETPEGKRKRPERR